jgi:hypothetical protein
LFANRALAIPSGAPPTDNPNHWRNRIAKRLLRWSDMQKPREPSVSIGSPADFEAEQSMQDRRQRTPSSAALLGSAAPNAVAGQTGKVP